MKEYGSRTIMREALRQELDAIQMGRDAVRFKRRLVHPGTSLRAQ